MIRVRCVHCGQFFLARYTDNGICLIAQDHPLWSARELESALQPVQIIKGSTDSRVMERVHAEVEAMEWPEVIGE